MATLRLSRPHDGGGILRRLRVEVDGREVAALEQGEVRIEVALPLSAIWTMIRRPGSALTIQRR